MQLTRSQAEKPNTGCNKKAVLYQGEPRDVAEISIGLRRPIEVYNGSVGLRAASLPQQGFLVGRCLQTAVNPGLGKSRFFMKKFLDFWGFVGFFSFLRFLKVFSFLYLVYK